jgi:uncharacterized membrane protein
MRTPASIANHPIHPMIVPLPIGLWIFSFICDLTIVLGSRAEPWFTLGFYTMIGGTIGAVLAAIPGTVDMFSLHGRVKKLALTHMALNVTIVLLYAVNIGMRISEPVVGGLPLTLSIVAVALLATSGWIGGHMVYVHRVAVNEGPSASE